MKINRDNDEKKIYHRDEPHKPAPTPPPAPPKQHYDVEQDEGYDDDEEYEEEAPVRRRRFPWGLIIVVLMLALVAYGGSQVMKFYQELDGKSTQGTEMTFEVEQGASVAAIAASLKEQGIIEYDWLFRYYAQYSGKSGGLQYGSFYVRPGMSYNEILNILSVQQAHRKTTNITIPEGSTAVAVAQIFVDAGLVGSVDEFLACANGTDGSDFSKYSFWNEIPDNGRIMKCEGYLYPETYNVYTDESVYYYVDTLYAQFASQTEGLMATIAEKGTTLDDVVIMASFIQEEAGLPAEDARVSACFHNRLETNDPLWAEHRLESNASSYIMRDTENNYLWNSPTAQYMGWVEQGAIPDDILAMYDTYAISGLPAGPITCPGYAAIEAALNPDQQYIDEGYFFFVTGHPNTEVAGQYFYAKTATEHLQNCVTAGWA